MSVVVLFRLEVDGHAHIATRKGGIAGIMAGTEPVAAVARLRGDDGFQQFRFRLAEKLFNGRDRLFVRRGGGVFSRQLPGQLCPRFTLHVGGDFGQGQGQERRTLALQVAVIPWVADKPLIGDGGAVAGSVIDAATVSLDVSETATLGAGDFPKDRRKVIAHCDFRWLALVLNETGFHALDSCTGLDSERTT